MKVNTFFTSVLKFSVFPSLAIFFIEDDLLAGYLLLPGFISVAQIGNTDRLEPVNTNHLTQINKICIRCQLDEKIHLTGL